MANPIVISCSKCSKEYKVEEKILGAMVKCKGCGDSFVAAVKKPPQSGPSPKVQEDDEEEGKVGKAYTIVSETETPKCANCAKELLNAKAIICVHCGFNSRTRTWNRTKKLVDKTAGDYILWHLPAIISSVVVVLGLASAQPGTFQK
ncbi:MAG: hypothetical protein ACKO26_24380 [Planctomycetota bacterium]